MANIVLNSYYHDGLLMSATRNYVAPHALLKDRVILITGAGNGIGAAVAKAYAKHQATVILLDKNIPALEKTYDDITALNAHAANIYPFDLNNTCIADYDELASNIDDNFSRLDGITHCAASIGQLAPVQHQSAQTWLETVHINLTAPYLLTRACLPLLQQNSRPTAIIFTTDNRKDKAYWSGYGISKAGIESLTKQLADELDDHPVRINCVDPGIVATALHARAFPAIDPTDLTKPDNVTGAYLYLMSEDEPTINGQIIKAQ